MSAPQSRGPLSRPDDQPTLASQSTTGSHSSTPSTALTTLPLYRLLIHKPASNAAPSRRWKNMDTKLRTNGRGLPGGSPSKRPRQASRWQEREATVPPAGILLTLRAVTSEIDEPVAAAQSGGLGAVAVARPLWACDLQCQPIDFPSRGTRHRCQTTVFNGSARPP